MSRYLTSLLFLALFGTYGCQQRKNSNDKQFIEGSGITAENGMVVSAHRESSLAGVSILQKGGNAVDAAVATEFALAVCYPEAGNIGGGGFMLIRTSKGEFDLIDYREKAPVKASRDMYLDKDGEVVEGLSTETHLASGVPGTVDGMIRVHARYGKLHLAEVLQPAIDLAEKGFILSEAQALSFNSEKETFLSRNKERTAFTNDSLWKQGDLFRQPDLAATLRLVRDKGRDGFYGGITAQRIIDEMNRGNGLIELNDLKEYSAEWRKPLSNSYHGYRISSIPPPSSGGTILHQLLGMIKGYQVNGMSHNSPEYIHLITEAERRAFADRSEFLGDPEFVSIPLAGLLDSLYLVNRMADFQSDRATPSAVIRYGTPGNNYAEETTHYSVVDKDGNAVAATTTLNGTFGNCIVVEGAGFLLNNQMDDFSSKHGFPNMYGLVGGEANSILPGKRMLSSMTPSIVEKDGKLFMVLGSPGGSTIPTTVFQVIINVIDFGMEMQAAVDAGRFHHQWLPDVMYYEVNAIDSAVAKRLENMGHNLKQRKSIGRVNAIMKQSDGSLSAGADHRGHNSAVGY